jgi:hypothetical protein
MDKYRVFKGDVFWSKVIFIFPMNISFEEIKITDKTSFLTKADYVGTFTFHEEYLNLFDSEFIIKESLFGEDNNTKKYYISYHIPLNETKNYSKYKNKY